MAYRGDDLDLRSPRMGREGASPSEYGANGSRSRTGGVTGGMIVDDTVLACCNHAFDIALAHGASDVRLEHLVHALTRVEESANILEDRGIREAHLRRESAAVIASEIPVGLAHTTGAPRASYEFEDVLRRASAMAAERGASASVHDLLWVLLNYDHDNPAIALLRRHAANWQAWEWPNRREPRGEIVREIVREVRVAEPPRRDDARREEIRREEVRRDDMRRDDTRRDPPRYAAERRDEPRRRQTYQVERQAAPGPQYAAPQYAAPQVIERVVQAPRNDEMFQRIDALEGTMHALMDMMRDLQADVQSGRGGGSVSVDVAPDAFIDHVRNVEATFDDRLAALERTVNTIASEGTRNWSQFADRFKAIDKIAAGSSNASGLADLVTEQLVAVTDQVRLSSDRLVRLEQANEKRDSDLQRAWSGIGERLRALDENFAMQKREIQQTLVSSGSSGQNLQSLVSERFQSVRQQLDENRLDLVSGMAQVVEPLTLKMRDIESAAERRQQEGGRQLSGLAERLVGFETLVRSQADSVAKASATHQRDLTEVHEALLKLGNNQKTLSDNLEQWRLEAGGDLGIISNRLELLERGSGRPIELIEQMQGDLANVTQLALADYDQNRRSFKTWLFGTSDVFAGSWRDETAAVRNRLSELRAKRQKA